MDKEYYSELAYALIKNYLNYSDDKMMENGKPKFELEIKMYAKYLEEEFNRGSITDKKQGERQVRYQDTSIPPHIITMLPLPLIDTV